MNTLKFLLTLSLIYLGSTNLCEAIPRDSSEMKNNMAIESEGNYYLDSNIDNSGVASTQGMRALNATLKNSWQEQMQAPVRVSPREFNYQPPVGSNFGKYFDNNSKYDSRFGTEDFFRLERGSHTVDEIRRGYRNQEIKEISINVGCGLLVIGLIIFLIKIARRKNNETDK